MSKIHFHKTNYEMAFVKRTKGEIRSTLPKRGNRDSRHARAFMCIHTTVLRENWTYLCNPVWLFLAI